MHMYLENKPPPEGMERGTSNISGVNKKGRHDMGDTVIALGALHYG